MSKVDVGREIGNEIYSTDKNLILAEDNSFTVIILI